MKYRTDKANEYFIVEHRTRKDLDAHLPASGLAVYHCGILGSNEWEDGTRNRHSPFNWIPWIEQLAFT